MSEHQNTVTHSPASASIDYNSKFKNSKPLLIICYILVGIGVLGLLMGLLGGGELMRTVINWLLGLVFGLDVLGIVAGIIIGIIFISKGSGEQGDKKAYYQRIAIWSFVGPAVLAVGIILLYVIFNVVFNLMGTGNT